MKKRVIPISVIVLIVISLGVTSAWFLASESKANGFKMGSVEIEVLEPGFQNLTNISARTYTKKVKALSKGTKKTYVRISLFPEWSEASLSISNVKLNLNNDDWVDGGDGFHYYKYYLTKGEETNSLLNSVTFESVGPEYDGETLTIKALAEGVQITNDGWKDVWGRTSLPFTPGIKKP